MPYCLYCAPSVVQFLINDVFRDMFGKFVIEYIDDILIYWLCKETNMDYLKQVLHRQKDNQHYYLAFKIIYFLLFYIYYLLSFCLLKLTPGNVTWGTDNSSALKE